MPEKGPKVVNIGDLEFEQRDVTMFIRGTPNGWYLVALEGKNGELRRFIMREVPSWIHEQTSQPIDF